MKKISSLLLIVLLVLSGCKPKAQEDFKKYNPQNDVYYEIFVRSFADSDGDGIGDLNGVTENLDYLDDLGVSGIWLMPINKTNSYHGYDILDYYDINPDYGTMNDFETLVKEADKRDIKIMIDLVINHTSDRHPWYLEASKGVTNPYRDYYVFNNGSAYSSFVGGMVDLNLGNDKVKEEIKDIFDFYLDKGVKGFRLDAAKHFFDNPGELTPTIKNTAFMLEMNSYIKEKAPDTFMVAEVFEYAYQFNLDYYLGADSILDFSIAQIIQNRIGGGTSAYMLTSSLDKIFDAYRGIDPEFVASPFITNHDLDRIANMPGFSGLNGLIKMKQAASVLLTLPGSPFIYYGDELGMKGARYEGTNIPGYGIVYDEYRRSPFLWGEAAKNTTWLPSDGSNDEVEALKDQKEDENSLYNHYKTLINLRQKTPALAFGNYFEVWNDTSGFIQGYVRYYEKDNYKQAVLVVHNLGVNDTTIDIDAKKVLFGSLTLKANETGIYELNSLEDAINVSR